MENNVNGVEVNTTVPKKSNAAWITGLIGFCIAIPNLIYIWACAAAATLATSMDEMEGRKSGMSSNDVWATGITFLVIIGLCCAVDFALCFMGKGKKSKLTGIIMIAVAALMMIISLFGPGTILALASGGLYIASGIVSIKNQSRAE